MKLMGKNSIFRLNVQIKISSDSIFGIASGTAMTLKALPIPSPIDIKVNKYFKKRDIKDSFDHLFEEVKQQSSENVELNFRMPVFKVVRNEVKQINIIDQLKQFKGLALQPIASAGSREKDCEIYSSGLTERSKHGSVEPLSTKNSASKSPLVDEIFIEKKQDSQQIEQAADVKKFELQAKGRQQNGKDAWRD